MTRLSEAEIEAALGDLTAWRRDGDAIRRTVKLRDFRAAIRLVNTVADAAEEANHHPDIEVRGYNRVTFTLTSHDAGGLTERDTRLAARIDALAEASTAG